MKPKDFYMAIRKSVELSILLLLAANSFAKQIPIQVAPYASGEVVFKWEDNSQHGRTLWHPDTISFSNGTKITLVEQDLYIVRNFSGKAAIAIIDSVSSVGYKYSSSLKRSWRGDTSWAGNYSKTEGNPDTNWNEVWSYPDSLAICDSLITGKTPQSDKLIVKAKLVYNLHRDLGFTNPYFTYIESGYNSILYIKAQKKFHMKIQINQIIIVPSGWSTYPYTINLLWAVDSLGNKQFKHDPVTIQQVDFNKKSIGFVMSESNGTIRYSIPQSSHRIEINLYALNGKKIKTLVNDHKPAGEYSFSLKELTLGTGLYYVQAQLGDKTVTEKVAIMK